MATISSLLADHVTLQVRSVDRLFLQDLREQLRARQRFTFVAVALPP